jgi:selT/selW/selH-like putative selenoprotein
VKGDNGAFEIARDGAKVFSKHEEGRFPRYQEIPNLLLGE